MAGRKSNVAPALAGAVGRPKCGEYRPRETIRKPGRRPMRPRLFVLPPCADQNERRPVMRSLACCYPSERSVRHLEVDILVVAAVVGFRSPGKITAVIKVRAPINPS